MRTAKRVSLVRHFIPTRLDFLNFSHFRGGRQGVERQRIAPFRFGHCETAAERQDGRRAGRGFAQGRVRPVQNGHQLLQTLLQGQQIRSQPEEEQVSGYIFCLLSSYENFYFRFNAVVTSAGRYLPPLIATFISHLEVSYFFTVIRNNIFGFEFNSRRGKRKSMEKCRERRNTMLKLLRRRF